MRVGPEHFQFSIILKFMNVFWNFKELTHPKLNAKVIKEILVDYIC